jgi:hypothetical protein
MVDAARLERRSGWSILPIANCPLQTASGGKISWNFGRFPLPLQPIKTTGRFIDCILLIYNLL